MQVARLLLLISEQLHLINQSAKGTEMTDSMNT